MRLEVTRKTDLAIRSLRALASVDGRVKGPELAKRIGTTAGFAPQVLSPLVTAGWVRSDPGPLGGYSLAGALDRISVLDVIEAVEGPTDSGRCVLVDGACSPAEPCSLHRPWQRARDHLLAELRSSAVGTVELRAVP